MIKNFLKGLLFGAAVGGTSGLLLAPKSGKETRDSFTNGIEELTEATHTVTEDLADFRDSLVQLKETANTLLPAFQADIKQDLQDFQFQAEPRLKQIQAQTEKIAATAGVSLVQEATAAPETAALSGRFVLKRPAPAKK